MNENSPTFRALITRRNEIAGQINHLHECITKAQTELEHLHAALEIMGYDVPQSKLRPKTTGTAGLFHRNEFPRLILQILKAHQGGLTCPQIAEHISRDKGWDTNDRRFQVALSKKVGKKLARIKRKYGLSCEKREQEYYWGIVAKHEPYNDHIF